MNDSQLKSAPPNSVASAVSRARNEAEMTVRELAKRAGISHTQIVRLESGEVLKPSREVLVSVSKGLDRNPLPLLILAGHMSVEEAQAAMKPMFREDAELPELWGEWATWPVETINWQLRDPHVSLDALKRVAAEVFSVPESDETMWDPSYRLAADKGEDARQLQEFMGIWRFLGQDLRDRWLSYGSKLRGIADAQYRVEMDELASRLEVMDRKLKKVVEDLSKVNPELAGDLRKSMPHLFGGEEDE